VAGWGGGRSPGKLRDARRESRDLLALYFDFKDYIQKKLPLIL